MITYNQMIVWLDTLPDNSIIEWTDYCTQAQIPIYSGPDTRQHAGYVAERNAYRTAVNDLTIEMGLHPYTLQPHFVIPNTPAGNPRRALIKVSGIDQLEDRIEHYERRVTNSHKKHRDTMKTLRNDPSLPQSEINRIDRLTYAADVIQDMFSKSLKIARNPLGKLSKIPKTSITRISKQATQLANDNKKKGV